ncbi:uncharacterized protein LOC114931082 isoform X2 [Nylanderia fulva]|uniref:uncharacterized protein LOC114931082 isoform X2 n=1 Tax=Nylanderia fulva TaxID=613905 RepID=UPI0010FAD612|nr:uncharacterized protein LOC114931082 isoform X2 [Nylanderia fulva]
MTTCEVPGACMATSAVSDHHETVEKASPDVSERISMNACPPSSFPDKFQDFFATLTEDGDDLPSMLENKLIPRKLDGSNVDGKNRRWNKRTVQRRSSEVEVRPHQGTLSGSQGHSCTDGLKSPIPSRRRSSSIAVARPTPDLHRFLQAETVPWGHLSPSSRSPTRTPTISPGAVSSTSHLSANASPSPTSPSGPTSGTRGPRQYRNRTSSMPAVPRHRPMLAETKRGGALGGEEGEIEDGVEYYRLRSFSITANGVFNLGDSLKTRRSKSINSVTSSTSCSSTRESRLLSSVSQLSDMETGEEGNEREATYKVGMLGASEVGKTALTAQFTTSEYICAYDASLDEEYGQKSVSVMLDGQETELEIIDHPAAEMSVETFCSTYNPDVYVVVYSVVDRRSFKAAEEMLLYLWKSDYMASHGVILVGNKVDLERKREVPSVDLSVRLREKLDYSDSREKKNNFRFFLTR